MDEQTRTLIPYLFPVFFIGLWIAITTLLGATSGWFSLQRRFPGVAETSLLTLRMRSGRLGLGVYMSGILTLSACPSGLRVSVLRIFDPFQRAFTVPWEQIKAEPRTLFFLPSTRLMFGDQEVGNLTIDALVRQRLVTLSSTSRIETEIAPVSVRRTGFAKLAMWIATTAIAATLFYFAPRAEGGVGPPILFCVGFPGIVFGLAMLVRFLRQMR